MFVYDNTILSGVFKFDYTEYLMQSFISIAVMLVVIIIIHVVIAV